MAPGAKLDSSTTSTGHGGNIIVKTTDMLSITGTLSDGTPGGVFSRTSGGDVGSGNGGTISLQGANVHIAGGAVVSAESTGPGASGSITIQGANGPANSISIQGPGSGIFTSTAAEGPGGSISLDANNISLNTGTISAASTGTVPSAVGGDITLAAGNSVRLQSGSLISSNSTGPGDAGNIEINAGKVFQMQDSFVTTEATQASGGNITIMAQDVAQLTNSTISTSVHGGPDTVGGNIDIDPQFVILQNSKILAQAVQGQGGNIKITAGIFMMDALSEIDASSQFGRSGEVTIQSPLSNLSASWLRLQQSYLEAAALLRQACAARLAAGESSLILSGRDRIPMEPGSWLSSPIALQGITGGGPVALAKASTAFDGETVSVRRYGISPFFHDVTNAGCG